MLNERGKAVSADEENTRLALRHIQNAENQSIHEFQSGQKERDGTKRCSGEQITTSVPVIKGYNLHNSGHACGFVRSPVRQSPFKDHDNHTSQCGLFKARTVTTFIINPLFRSEKKRDCQSFPMQGQRAPPLGRSGLSLGFVCSMHFMFQRQVFMESEWSSLTFFESIPSFRLPVTCAEFDAGTSYLW